MGVRSQAHMDHSAEATSNVPDGMVRHRIVETALGIAEAAGSWDAVHVHAVAREAGITLEELARHFEGKDAMAEGYFDRADAALMIVGQQPGWADLPIRERLYLAMMTWMDTLAPHRRLAGQMLLYRFQPEHLHLQARGIARISRTVQWFREVTLMPSTGWRRELEEATLTSIYLATFACWLADSTPGSERTRRLLRRLLAGAEEGARWLGNPA